jgi:hypothetical protein
MDEHNGDGSRTLFLTSKFQEKNLQKQYNNLIEVINLKELYWGVDIHKESYVGCILNEKGFIREQKKKITITESKLAWTELI